MRRNVLVPFDGSESAQAALKSAIELAKQFGEAVFLVNVQPSLTTPNTKKLFTEQTIREYQTTLYEESIQTGIEIIKYSGIPYEAKLLVGLPKEEICQAAKDLQVRYIVMGSRGYSTFVGTVLGSVSQGVLYQADCPVMIVSD